MGSTLDLSGVRRVLLISPPMADTDDAERQQMIVSVAPFGLLRLATWFRGQGCEVDFLDCLRDPAVTTLRGRARKTLRCGNWDEEGIEKTIYHYGLDGAVLESRLKAFAPPDLIGIGSVFTWHGDAVRDTIASCRHVFPGARIVLGGNFATLCPEEAGLLGADQVVSGDIPGAEFLPSAIDLSLDGTSPDFVRMIKGCPNKCSYCVTNYLNAGRVATRDPDEVIAEIESKRRQYGTRYFIFYDDFVMFRHARFLDPFLDRVAASGMDLEIEFALGFAAHMVTEALADRLRAAGVNRVILALETVSDEDAARMNRPHHIRQFRRAVRILKARDFKGDRLRAFLLMGLPDQTTREILRGILFLYHLGVTPSLTTYTLTPRSLDMERHADRVRGLPLDELGPCLWRFAHSGMRVRELDAIYRYFHERFIPLPKILASDTQDPIIRTMQEMIRAGEHRVGGV